MRKKESWARSLARIIKSMKNIIDDKSQNVKTTKQNQAMPFRVVFLSSTSRSPSSTVVIFQWFFDFLIASDWPKNDRVSLMERFLRCAIFARFRAMAKVKTQIKSSLHSFFFVGRPKWLSIHLRRFFFGDCVNWIPAKNPSRKHNARDSEEANHFVLFSSRFIARRLIFDLADVFSLSLGTIFSIFH